MHSATKRFTAIAAVAVLAACSGRSGALIPAMPGPGTGAPAAPAAQAEMRVTIPAPSKARTGVSADYVSASTQSVTLRMAHGSIHYPAQTLNTTPGSPGCTALKNGGTACTLKFRAIVASVTYSVSAYDRKGGAGNLLATAHSSMTIVAGKANVFRITLNGAPSRFTMTAAQASVTEGTPQSVALTVSAYDADGNLIVNSPAYWNSGAGRAYSSATVTIGNSGAGSSEFQMTQNGKTLAAIPGHPSSFSVKSPFANIAVYYTGSGLAEGSFTLKTPAGVTAPADVTVKQKVAVTPANLYVAGNSNTGGNLYAFPLPFHQGESALPLLQNQSGQIVGLATDGYGTVAVVSTQKIALYHGTPGSANSAFVSYAYPSGFSANGEAGNVAAFDPNGNLYVTAQGSPSAVLRYAAPFTTATTPSALHLCTECDGIGFDASGTMYVGDTGAGHANCGFGEADNVVNVVKAPYADGTQSADLISCSQSGSAEVADVHGVSATDAGDASAAGVWAGLGLDGISDAGNFVPYAELRNNCRDGFGNPPSTSNFAVSANTLYFSNSIGPSNGIVCSISPATAPTPAPNQNDENVTNAAALPAGIFPFSLILGP